MALPLFQKGMCFVTWDKNQFATEMSQRSLDMLKSMGVEFVQINATYYQEKFNSTEIKATELTPTDASIRHAIRYAHKIGLKVMLKPHIDLIDTEGGTYWRADIGFNNDSDWEKWFVSYDAFIKHYAEIADKLDVEIFCIGTEFTFAVQKDQKWEEIIHTVRKNYDGLITYAANWDDYKEVKFWDKLDFIGIDAYFPLSYAEKPSLDELKTGWDKWKADIGSWLKQNEFTQKVIFTEIGYASTGRAAQEPWKSGESGNPDIETQAKCYQAFFETIWSSAWLTGVYWWKWSPTIYGGGPANRNYTPLNKPAAKILEINYKNRTCDMTYIDQEAVDKSSLISRKEKQRSKGSFPMVENEKVFRERK
jgi:hypothetical protein